MRRKVSKMEVIAAVGLFSKKAIKEKLQLYKK